jgi:hypothetical protein
MGEEHNLHKNAAGNVPEHFAKIAAYCAIAILACATYVAITKGLADVYALQARTYLEASITQQSAFGREEWQSAHRTMSVALEFDSNNPLLLEEMGRICDGMASERAIVGMDALATRRRALDMFERALGQSPSSPYKWINVAIEKDRIGEFDGEALTAMNLATRLGPWEPGVQLAVAELGLTNWSFLGLSDRARVGEIIARAARNHPDQIRALATNGGRIHIICPILKDVYPSQACP